MLLKNIGCVLLIFLCINTAFFPVGKGQIAALDQYRASSKQVIKFLQVIRDIDLQAIWKNAKNKGNGLDELKQTIQQQLKQAVNAIDIVGRATVYELLEECFGKSIPETNLIKQAVKNSIYDLNFKWQRSKNWAACRDYQTVVFVLSLIGEAMCRFFDRIKELDDLPEFWLAVTNLRSEENSSETMLKVDFIVASPHDVEHDKFELTVDTDDDDVRCYANLLTCYDYGKEYCYVALPVGVGVICVASLWIIFS